MAKVTQIQKLTEKMFSGQENTVWWSSNDIGALTCPFCKDDEYVHHGTPYEVQGGDYEASEVHDIGVRGSVLVIPFESECGHEWVLVFGQHKGITAYKIVQTYEREKPGHDRQSLRRVEDFAQRI